MWKQFIIFALLQVAVLTGDKQEAAETITTAPQPTPTRPTTRLTTPTRPTTRPTTPTTTPTKTTHEAINGAWSEYGTPKFGSCSVTCGNGTNIRTRTRTCTNPKPAFGGNNCTGNSSEQNEQICSLRHCPVNGAWSEYGAPKCGSCSVTCGNGTQIRTRTRTCTNPKPAFGGNKCTGNSSEQNEQICSLRRCPVNGGWSNYTIVWTECSNNCGDGNQTEQKTRTCTNPMPMYGGENCTGNASLMVQHSCFLRKCPDPPKVLTNQTQTSESISLYINPANSNFTSFLISCLYLNSTELETTSTNYTVHNLVAASCYNISVLTKFHDVVSSQAISHRFCTAPPAPDSAIVTSKSSTSISITVVSKYWFDVFMNGKLFFSSSTNTDFDAQTVKITNLTPGSTYRNIQVSAFYQGLRSSWISLQNSITEIHLPPAPPSSVEIFAQTNDSFSFNITHGAGIFDQFKVSLNGIYKNFTADVNSSFTIAVFGGLNPGILYKNITVRASSHSKYSVPTQPIHHSTNPNPPSNVRIEDKKDTSVSLSIVSESEEFDKIFVCIEKTEIYVEKLKKNKVVIRGLEPGYQYLAMVKTSSNGLNSTPYRIIINTYPDRPKAVYLLNRTTETLRIKIVKGKGMIQWFYIQINERYNVTGKANQTEIVLGKLTPGQMYSKITVQAVSHGLYGEIKHMNNTSTVPDAPSLVQVTENTTETLHLTIEHGKGIVESFDIDINGKIHSKQVTSGSNTTNITITNLIPGTSYKDIAIISKSNGLKSSAWKISLFSTCPDVPKSVEVTHQTNRSVSLKVEHGEGVTEAFYIYVNDIYQLTKNVTEKTHMTDIVIQDLTPGTLYKVTVQSMSHKLKSEGKDAMPHATNPDGPKQITVVNQTTESIIVNITHGYGNVQLFYFQVNSTYNFTIPSAEDANNTIYTIPELIPGTKYINIVISSVAYELHSVETLVQPEATYPEVPLSIQCTGHTTESLTFDIYHGKGNVDFFDLQVNASYSVNVSATNEAMKTAVKLNKLIPGMMYDKIKIQAFSNYLGSNIKDVARYATNPEEPSSIQCTSHTTDSLTFDIYHGKGIVDFFNLQVNASYSLNVTAINGAIKTKVKLNKLIPGMMYDKIRIQAFSNYLGSNIKNVARYATIPPEPFFDVTGIASSEVNLTVRITGGHVDIYKAKFESKEANANCLPHLFTTKLINPTSATVDHLTPGTKYEISVSAISNNLTSWSKKKTLVTKPSIPKFVISDTSIHSFTITITKGEGCVDHFEIYIDGKRKKIVPVSNTSNTITSVIDNLEDGKDFKINVLAVSYNSNSTRLLPLSDATDKNMVPVIGGAFGGILAALAIVAFVVVWRKQLLCFRGNTPKDISDGRSNEGFDGTDVEMTDSRKKRPIKLSEFAASFDEKSRNTHMGFSSDFKDLTLLSPKHDSNISQIQENRPKNRYTNILPFDHSLVKLIGIEDEPGSDFINANYIPGFNSPREYIASQGPLPATLADFWRMVWEQNVSIIVMLTQLIERGRKKCELYWPENTNEKRFFGDIIVEVKGVSYLQDYALREIELHLGDLSRKVRHYNYLAWPDMGTPKTTSNMINFVDTIRQEVKPSTKGPMLVHCSAGVGRTGTFIIMDVLLQELRSGRKEVDIFGKILNMRNNRVNMVQTEDQYTFIFKCIKDFNDVTDDEEEDPIEPVYENFGANV